MGYTSQVAMYIRGKGTKQVLAAHLLDNEFKRETVEQCLLDPDLIITEDGIYLQTSGKWYDSYEDVQWYMGLYERAMEMLNDAAPDSALDNLYGEFVRVGEDNNDIEERSFGDPHDYLCRVEVVLNADFPSEDTRKDKLRVFDHDPV